MNLFRKKNGLSLILTCAMLSSCGGLMNKITGKTEGDAGGSSEPAKNNSTNVEGELDLTNLTVLTPAQMADKIYKVFGRKMTLTTIGEMEGDYLQYNAGNFTGNISGDPNNRIAAQFSIGFFLALAGLSDVVAKNYQSGLYNGNAVNDCRKPEDAKKMLIMLAPNIRPGELETISNDTVIACKASAADAVRALVQSYSFAVSL